MDENKNVIDHLIHMQKEQDVPNQLDQYILCGIDKRSQERKRNKRNKWILGAIACLFLLFTITTIRVSPAFANYISGLPGGKYFVDLVHFDKGLQEAIQHDYATPIMKSDEHHGLKWTIEGMTIDESRMVLFYSVENIGSIDYATINKINFKEGLSSFGVSYGSFHENLSKNKIDYGQIDVNFTEDTHIPDELTVGINFTLRDQEGYIKADGTEWLVTFSIEKENFIGLKKEYSIQEEVLFAGQKIYFLDATIYPTRMALRIKFNEKNEQKIFTFEDLVVVNEKGERWSTSTNGLTASHINDYERILYLESSYFHNSNELYLEASQVRALPENERKVIIDLEKSKIIQGPTGLYLKELTTTSAGHSFTFVHKLDERYDNPHHTYQILSNIIYNLYGEEIETIKESGTYSRYNQDKEFFFSIPKQNENQLVFEIIDYSTRLIDDLKVKIK